MDHDDSTPAPPSDPAPDPLDGCVGQARRDLEQHLVPEPPPFRVLGERARRQRRRSALAGVGVASITALIVVAVAVHGGDSDGPTKEAARTTVPVDVGPPVQAQLLRSDAPRAAGAVDAIPAAVEANTAFALDLHRELAASEEGNLFLSPHSISVALSMTLAGTDGDTRTQLEDALHIEVPEAAFHDAINALDQALVAPRTRQPGELAADPLELTTANSLWGQAGYSFREEFLDRIAQSYDAGMNVVDFVTRAEASRVAINAWVAEHTDGKITELIPPDVITSVTRLVLVNTITFKASWFTPFRDVISGRFTTLDGTKVKAEMMRGGSGRRASGDGWESVAIPYVGGAHMVVIVPDDLAAFERSLTPNILDAAAGGREFAPVTLPKFSTTSELDLIPPLQALGVADAFVPGGADFSRIDGSRDLYVSAVLHQATIAVDEKGTEAAAATAVIIDIVSTPLPIVVDRPFFYAIRDDATGAILFTGRVTDPTG